ncbi:hypothetical protein cd2_103 [Carnobacterium phage cd2]|uniref:Uncharacterized protein n=1 Tax=Carnobacterium phage cd2 TaxID=2849244 RepID=A0AAE7VIH9_9CAUD|nr:hypothetical protein PQD68_gp103 [Carnobacterium phage cd2]QXP45119.1 hypothetical protein cd2_103 [Carnobacterium phage cd2]
MGIFKNKEKLYRLEVEGSYFSHSEGNLNLKELILKASENDPQLPIHKLVRSIDLGMLEMKADEYTYLEADNMKLEHLLAIAKNRIEELEGQLLEPEETFKVSEYKQAWLETNDACRKWELDYFELQKEFFEVKEVLRQARQDAMEAHAELDSLSEAWSNEQKLRKQADEQVLELSRKLNSSKEREAGANFNAFEAYNEHRESSYEYFKEAMEKLTAIPDLQSDRVMCVPNEPMSVVQLLPQEVLKLQDILRESETISFYTGDTKWAEEVYKRNKNKMLDTALAELDIARCRVRDCTDTLNCHKYIALVELVDSLM